MSVGSPSNGRVKIVDELREIFSDGEYHAKRDLVANTNCNSLAALTFQLIYYRKTLPEDEKLVCELVHRTIGYRHVKLLKSTTSK